MAASYIFSWPYFSNSAFVTWITNRKRVKVVPHSFAAFPSDGRFAIASWRSTPPLPNSPLTYISPFSDSSTSFYHSILGLHRHPSDRWRRNLIRWIVSDSVWYTLFATVAEQDMRKFLGRRSSIARIRVALNWSALQRSDSTFDAPNSGLLSRLRTRDWLFSF